MDAEHAYQMRIELTRALLAVQMLKRRKDLAGEHAAYAEVIERSLRNLKDLAPWGDPCSGPARDRQP